MVEACNEGDFSKVRKLLDEGRVSVHDTTEEGESLLSLACSAGYYELAQVNFLAISRNFSGIKKNKKKYFSRNLQCNQITKPFYALYKCLFLKCFKYCIKF